MRVARSKRTLQPTYLKQWRLHRNLTQEQAAERLEISRTLLSKIENAKSPYSQGLLEAAAEAYGCTAADLIVRDPTKPDAVWAIHDNLLKATPEQRSQIAIITDALMKTGTNS